MKRFAAHYLFLPEVGFLKHHVVELTPEGRISTLFPLTQELESVAWFPGVIACLPQADILTVHFSINAPTTTAAHFSARFDNYKKKGISLFPFLFYPFDFTSMQSVAETRHRLLR